MRSFAIALLILGTLCLGSFQQCASQAQLDLVRRLVQGVELKSTELKTDALDKTQLCAAAFSTNGGFCCVYDSVKAFANQLIATLKQQFAGIDSVIATFPSILDNLPRLLEHLTLKDPSNNSDPDFVAAIGGEKAYYAFQAILQHLTTQAKTIAEDITAKKFDTAACLKSIFNQKLSTICLACSGAAGKFFNPATNKFILRKAGIQGVLTSCVATFDVFNKVTHALQVFRVINKALSSKDATATTAPADFSLEKMLKYEECRKNPELYNNDNAKLLSMSSELGGATKPPVVATRATENVAAVPEFKASAATGFKDAMDRENTKLQAIKTERQAQATQLSSTTAGSPPKVLSEQLVEVTSLETQRTTAYKPALTTLSTSTSTGAQRTEANSALLTYAKLAKKSIEIYTKLRGVVEKFISSAKDELIRTTDATKANGFVANQQEGLGLLEKLKRAIDAATQLDAVIPSVEAAGTAITSDLNEKYRRLLQVKSDLDLEVKNAVEAQRPAIQGVFTAVENRFKNEAAIADRNIQLSTNRAQAVDKQKEVDTKREAFDTARKNLEPIKAKVVALNGIKAQLSGNLPVTAELTNAGGEWTARQSGLKALITGAQAAKTSATSSTTTGLPQSITMLDTNVKGEVTKIQARITAINTRLAGTDTTAAALSTSVTTATASIETLNAEIKAQEAIVSTKQALIGTLKTSLPPLQTDLYAKAAVMRESFGKINLQLAQIADYKGKINTLEAEYAARTATLTGEKDIVTKLNIEKCGTTVTNPDQTYCAGLAAKIASLTEAIAALPAQKQTALAPLQQALASLDTALTALRTAHAPLQTAHDTALAAVKKVDTDIQAAVTAINAALVIIADKRRLIMAKETERQVQTTSTSSFNSDIKLKVDEELKIQLTELQALLPIAQQIATFAATCVRDQNVQGIKDNLAAFDTAVASLQQRDQIFTTRIQAFTAFKSATDQKIQSQITQVTTDVTAATAEQTAAQTAHDAAKSAFDAAKAQLDTLLVVPPPPSSAGGRRLRRMLEIAEEDVDIEFSETSGADTDGQFGAGVQVDTNLASTSTFPGATDPTKLETTAAPQASGSFSQIAKLCGLALLTTLTILI